jgi:Flp pilus assembly protein TadG
MLVKDRANDFIRRLSEPFARRLAGLARDERGVSAVEFALLLPLMLTIYLGAAEVSQGIAADRKVTLTARAIADLCSQASSLTAKDMENSMLAAVAVMAPYPDSNMKVTVSSVKIDANGNATVEWSESKNGTARAKGSGVTLLPALKVPNTWLIFSEVEYAYKPTIGYVLSGTLTLKDQIFMRPRMSDSVTYPAT